MGDFRLTTLRGAYRVAYWLLQIRALVLRRKRHGVKCILTHRGEVLLVRHAYGPREAWQLPGGVAHRGEPAARTAAREMQEELGLKDLDWRELAKADLWLDHVPVALTCLQAELTDPFVRPDPVEIEQARWFGYDDLPSELGREEQQLLDLLEHRES